MAYNEIYERINWENEIVSKSTPLGAVNLNKMDYALKEIDKRVAEMSKNQDSFLTEEEASENYATKSETEEIATEVSKGKADVIHATASGESIHATDSTDNKVVEFALLGKATQKTYSGKNLLKNTGTTQTINGVTFTVNEDGSVTANGTATSDSRFFVISALPEKPLTKDTEYIFSGVKGGSDATYMMTFHIRVTDEHEGLTLTIYDSEQKFTAFDSTYNNSTIFIRSGVTVNNVTFYPMIRLASVTDDTYEPYTNGPSPNPEYPQEIEVAGSSGSVEVKSVGKNLLKNTATSKTTNGVTFTVNEDGSITANGTASARVSFTIATFKASANKGYSLSGVPVNANGVKMVFNAKALNYPSDSGSGNTFYPQTETEAIVYIEIPSGTTVSNLTFGPMIRLASDTEGTYEPYKESTTIISTPNGLAGIKVSSGGNYIDASGQQWITDEIVKYADGSGQRIQRVAENSSFNFWSQGQSNYGYIYAFTYNGKNSENTPFLSNCFHFVNNKSSAELNIGEGYVRTGTSTPVISVCSDISTVEEFQNWISNNGVLFYTILAEPIITDLTAEEIAELEAVQTFYPTTNILNDAGCGMEVTYLADTKNYIDKIIGARLSALESALINNI